MSHCGDQIAEISRSIRYAVEDQKIVPRGALAANFAQLYSGIAFGLDIQLAAECGDCSFERKARAVNPVNAFEIRAVSVRERDGEAGFSQSRHA